MDRRKFLTLLRHRGRSLTLAACSRAGVRPPAQRPTDSPTGRADGQRLEPGPDPEFHALFDAFHQAEPEHHHQARRHPRRRLPDKVTTMLAGGDSTDVITMKKVTDYSRYAARGQLKDLTSIATSGEAATLNGLDSYKTKDGKYYALPYRQDFWVLYYNKKLFTAAGKQAPDNLTWDQYSDLAKNLTTGSGSDKVYGTYHHIWRSVVQAISAAQTGGNLLGGDYSFFTDQYKMALGIQDAGATLDFATATTQKIGYATVFETRRPPCCRWAPGSSPSCSRTRRPATPRSTGPSRRCRSGRAGARSPRSVRRRRSPSTRKPSTRPRPRSSSQFAAGPEGAKAITAIGVVPVAAHRPDPAGLLRADRDAHGRPSRRRRSSRTRSCWRCRPVTSPPKSTRSSPRSTS